MFFGFYMSGLINFYVVSTVHLKNVEILARSLPGYQFRLLYEDYNPWINDDVLKQTHFEGVAFSENNMPEALWAGHVDVLVFSTAQPRVAPLSLLEQALLRDIRTIAIEETMQVSLNQGRVNNYVLPVNQILAASSQEKAGLVATGIPEHRIDVAGWPFYAGPTERPASCEIKAQKKTFGLDENRPVVSLTLTGLNEAGESPEVRIRQLTLAFEGLPKGFQLLVKPHPSESLDVLMPYIEKYAPDAFVLDGKVSIHDMLRATDILLNRGVSQVCIEALISDIPVVVLETGVITPFHKTAADVVVTSPEALQKLLLSLLEMPSWQLFFDAFRADYLPFSTHNALEKTCWYITDDTTICDQRDRQWFDLALLQGWRFDRSKALNMLDRVTQRQAELPVEPLRRLLQYVADRDDLNALIVFTGQGFFEDVLKCMWLDQMIAQKRQPDESDCHLMETFPPALNAVWFVAHNKKWTRLLFKYKKKDALQRFERNAAADFLKQVPGMPEIQKELDLFGRGMSGRIRLNLRVFMDALKDKTRPLRQRFANKKTI